MNKSAYNPLDGERPEMTINLHDGSDEQISIIVVHKDSPHYLNLCIQSIAVTSFNNNYEVIIVDNNSGKETQDFLDEIEDESIKIVRNEKNLYWSAAANRGAAAADKRSKYLVFMHADVSVLYPGWLDNLINVLAHQNAGIVGFQFHTYEIGNQRVNFVEEWCMMMSRQCWDKIAPWPEELPMAGHAFIMTRKAQRAGFSPQGFAHPEKTNGLVHHYKAFNVDFNEYEIMCEEASLTIPKLLRQIESVSVS